MSARTGHASTGGASRAAAMAVAAPVVAATLVTVLFVVMEAAGRLPMSYTPPRNIAEAAGLGMASEVLRFLREGQDPARVYPVRPDIISAGMTQVTALEASIWSRRVELVRMLDRQGAIPGHPERDRLACIASAIGIDSIETYLAPDGLTACDEAATIEGIEVRSR